MSLLTHMTALISWVYMSLVPHVAVPWRQAQNYTSTILQHSTGRRLEQRNKKAMPSLLPPSSLTWAVLPFRSLSRLVSHVWAHLGLRQMGWDNQNFKRWATLKFWLHYVQRHRCQGASVMSNSVRPHGLQPTRLLRPWDSPGKNTGVGCHFLLHVQQPRPKKKVNCRSTGEGIHNGVHVHNGIHLNHKEVGINAKSSVRKESRDDHSNWSKRDRDRLVSYDITSRCNIKMDTNELTAQRHRLTDLEKKLLVIKI